MADEATPDLTAGGEPFGGAALQHRPWRKLAPLSSGLVALERFLGDAGFDRAPWVAAGFAAGIGLWFDLMSSGQWLALVAACLAVALGTAALLRGDGDFPYLRQSLIIMSLALMVGCLTVWAKSALVGEAAIARPMVSQFSARVLTREDQPAEGRLRLLLAMREPESQRPIRIRVNVPLAQDQPGLDAGALVRLKARLMPPAPPMLPGGYDFARAAWFQQLAATGSALGPVKVIVPGGGGGWLARLKHDLSVHVRTRLDGSAGGIAAAFASGDRGAIATHDEEAMRDSGLTHLLSISGLHVSAVIAAVYVLAIRLLALWPWLALRARLPIMAAGVAALAGIFYTLLTGAEVPTVRSCVGAVLVLLALALGREPLSLRMLAVAAIFVMALWPEAVVGPSFQMSFGAVIAIIALHGCGPVRQFLAPRDQPWWQRGLRHFAMLLLTGVVIELALLPIGLFHFHRAGVYGAFANVIAIPLTTFVSMPLVGLALLFDVVGAGAPLWWLAGQSLELLLALAHWMAAQPGAVTHFPAMPASSFALFLLGALWLALWRGRVRLWGLTIIGLAMAPLAMLRPPDILVSGDGRHVGITGEAGDELLVLREGRSDFARENLTELAGMSGKVIALANWPSAQCSPDFCVIVLKRAGRDWRLLIGRSRDAVPERALAAACDRVDIVIADRWLPRSCQPAWLKADRRMLTQSGGLAIDLAGQRIRSVAQDQGEHGWWRVPERRLWNKPEHSARPPHAAAPRATPIVGDQVSTAMPSAPPG